MKLKLLLLATGLTLFSAGAASACSNSSICGSGWQDRGSKVTSGGHTQYVGGGSHASGSGYGYGSGVGYGGGGGHGYGGGGGNGYGGSSKVDSYNSNSNANSNKNNNSAIGNTGTISGGSAKVNNTNGQSQNQNQSVSNSGNNTVSNAGNNTLSADVNNTNTNNISNSSDNRSSNSASTNVSYSNVVARAPVATAYAAPLVASQDTCMGSTSVGGQGITIGFSAATTWTDRSCVRLKTSRELNAMGMSDAACELLAMDKEVAEALRRTGANCAAFRQVVQRVEFAPPPPPMPRPLPPPPPSYEPPPHFERAGERG